MTDHMEPIPGQVVAEPLASPTEPDSSLPFVYERTENEEDADYKEWRVSPIVFKGKTNEPYTDEKIIESVRRRHEAKEWFTSDYWREKGKPKEQLEFYVDGQQITVYNFSKEKPFTDDHIERAKNALGKLASHFPRALDNLRWILIDDIQPPSILADDALYPTNGTAMREHKAFRFTPRGMEMIPHRIKATSNFEGTFVHELGHLMQHGFEGEWGEKYQWEYCMDNTETWELRDAPGGEKKWFNKGTGEMSPQGNYSLQPDECVTLYGRQNMGEDICESLVAYLYDPRRLEEISERKYGIFKKHDANQTEPVISVDRVTQEDIRLPELKPKTIYYYVEEPSDS